MVTSNFSSEESKPNGSPRVPPSLLKANRNELCNLKLNVIQVGEKPLPEDLQGHVFIIAPVGTVDSGGLPFESGDSFLCGDGMVYRFSFDGNGEVLLNSKITKAPDYYADYAAATKPKYAKYKFQNHGIMRFSLCLGFRNDLSIAFLPMQFAQDSQPRLLVTYDAGRHYEIDTETLEVVTPVGWNKEWQGEIKFNLPLLKLLNFPFTPILSTAHPAFDVRKSEMFTVDYGRSLSSFIRLVSKSALKLISPIADSLYQFIQPQAKSPKVLKNWRQKLEITKDFVYLIRWDGQGELERWRLVLPDNSPVKITQSIHQMAVTEDYVVIVDTSYTTGLEQALNDPLPNNPKLEEWLRQSQDAPLNPNTPVYLVPRDRLINGQKPASSQQEVTVTVVPLSIGLEITHFLVDYDNPQHRITLHAAHTCSWDVSEWIRKYDVSAYPPYNSISDDFLGMEQSELDISRVGRYVIDGKTGDILEQKVIPEEFNPEAEDCRCTWGVALYASLDRLPSQIYTTPAPGKLDNIYWVSLGLWEEFITQFMVEFSKGYSAQKVSLADVCRIAQNEGRPSCLFRMDTASTESMKIADCYEFPAGHIGLSPQFVPRGDGNSSTDGYIVCAVWHDNAHEIWIFEAWNLRQGPQWKLCHELLNFGVTLHTAWLPAIARRQARYYVPVADDYQEAVAHKPGVRELFENEVYPYFQQKSS